MKWKCTSRSRVKTVTISDGYQIRPSTGDRSSKIAQLSILVGTLLYYRAVVVLQACTVYSKILQRIGLLKKGDLLPTGMAREGLSLTLLLCLYKSNTIHKVSMVTLFNASHVGTREVPVLSEALPDLKIAIGNNILYFQVLWPSHNQRQFCCSCYEAEMSTTQDADNRSYCLKTNAAAKLSWDKSEVWAFRKLKRNSYDTNYASSTKRLPSKKVAIVLRDSFEPEKLDVVCWI